MHLRRAIARLERDEVPLQPEPEMETPSYKPSLLAFGPLTSLNAGRRLTAKALAAHNRKFEDWNQVPLAKAHNRMLVHDYPNHPSGYPTLIEDEQSIQSPTTLNDSSLENNDRLSREHFPSEDSQVCYMRNIRSVGGKRQDREFVAPEGDVSSDVSSPGIPRGKGATRRRPSRNPEELRLKVQQVSELSPDELILCIAEVVERTPIAGKPSLLIRGWVVQTRNFGRITDGGLASALSWLCRITKTDQITLCLRLEA